MPENKPVEQDSPSSTTEIHITGWLDVITEHVNAHLRLYRAFSWVAGSVGVVLLLRYTGVPISRLKQVSDIPKRLVSGNGSISGIVKTTSWNTIGVWHVPWWRWLVRWGIRPPDKFTSEDLLPVQFSGVTISDAASSASWLQERLLGQKVWLKLLDYSASVSAKNHQHAIQCVVHSRGKGMRKRCVNEELLSLGLGSVEKVTGFVGHTAHAKFVSRLAKSEKIAKGKGRGMWEGTEHVTMLNRIRNYF